MSSTAPAESWITQILVTATYVVTLTQTGRCMVYDKGQRLGSMTCRGIIISISSSSSNCNNSSSIGTSVCSAAVMSTACAGRAPAVTSHRMQLHSFSASNTGSVSVLS